MKKQINLLAVIAVVLGISACETDKTYQGVPQIAFAAKTYAVSIDTDKMVTIPVQLIASGAQGEIVGSIAIDASSTLEDGVAQVPTQVTIPAGSFSAEVKIRVSYAQLDSIKRLDLKLTSDVKVAANYNAVTVTLTKMEPTVGFASKTLSVDIDTNKMVPVVVNVTRPGGAGINGDVVADITVVSSPVNGVTVPPSVTVPAGKLQDTLWIPVTYATLPNTSSSSLKLKLTTADSRLVITTDAITVTLVKKYPTIEFGKGTMTDTVTADKNITVALKAVRTKGFTQDITGNVEVFAVLLPTPLTAITLPNPVVTVPAGSVNGSFDIGIDYDALTPGKNVITLKLTPATGVKSGTTNEITITLIKQ